MSKSLNIIQNNFKELPNNIEAEQSVIGSILTHNEIFDEISGIIIDKNFFDPLHQKIFGSISVILNVWLFDGAIIESKNGFGL